MIRNHPLVALYAIAIPLLMLYNLTGGSICFDTVYYQLAGDKLFCGEIDCLRTPVYPLLLKLCALRGGAHQVLWVTVVQSLTYLLSVAAFYKVCQRLISCRRIANFVALIYVTIPVPSWCHVLLTESLSISGSVFLLYYILLFIDAPKTKYNILIHVLVVSLVFLRPTFIIYLVILPILWLYYWVSRHDRSFLCALLVCVVPIVCYVAYCGAYQQKYNRFGSTLTSQCNAVFTLKFAELWNPDTLPTARMRETCAQIDANWIGPCGYDPVYKLVEQSRNVKAIDDVCRYMIEQNKSAYYTYRFQTLINSFNDQFPIHVECKGNMLSSLFYCAYRLFCIPISILYVAILFGWIIVVRFVVKGKRISIPILLLLTICTLHCGGVSTSAIDSFGRVMLPVFPFMLILLTYPIDRLCVVRTPNDTCHHQMPPSSQSNS